MTCEWHVKKYREKRVTNKTTCLCKTKPVRDLRGCGRGSGNGKAGWEKPWTPGDGSGMVSTTSSISLSELLSSEKVVLSGLTMPHFACTTVKKRESTWEHL